MRQRVIRTITLVVVVYSTGLAILSLALGEDPFEWLFGEGGPIEVATMWGWVGLALFCPLALRRLSLASVCGAVLCLAAAAREADWHKRFTGYSVMKIGFYHDADRGIGERLFALLVVGLVIASGVIVVRCLVMRWCGSSRDQPDWRIVTAISIGWLFVMKVADRFRDVFNDLTGIEFGDTSRDILSAWEEGGELLLPVLFGASVWMFARSSREN
jgi:hypothetical protein